MEKLNAISLFSGIGGFELGLSKYCRTVLYCEADRHAQAVLLSRMAENAIDVAPISTDIRELTAEFIDIPIDIIYGGFPCQDISSAGKGAGLEGKRSGLFFEIMRLAKEVKPTFIFLENVPAIRTRGLARVIEELTEAGYDSRWCMLSAAEVGAPHKRERWFCLAANTNSTGTGRRQVPDEVTSKERRATEAESESLQSQNGKETADNPGKIRSVVADTASRESGQQAEWQGRKDIRGRSSDLSERQTEKSEVDRDDSIEAESDVGRLVDGISDELVQGKPAYLDASYWEKEPENVPRVTQDKEQRVERIKRLGNAVVPLQVKTAFEYLMGINLVEEKYEDIWE